MSVWQFLFVVAIVVVAFALCVYVVMNRPLD